MNLIMQAVENIYEHGNAILHLREKPDCKIIFYVENSSELCIRIEKDYGDNLIETFDLNAKE